MPRGKTCSPHWDDLADVKTTLLLPVRNEIVGLRRYLPEFLAAGLADQLLVLDGRSTDGSADYARSLGCEVVVQSGRGMRSGYLECWSAVRGDAVVVFSPDGNSLPESVPALFAALRDGYDLVIASRYKDGARSDDDTVLSGLGNFVFTRSIGSFGYPYTDAMVMLRGFRRELPHELGLTRHRSPRWEASFGRHVSWEPLMSIRAAKAGLRIGELPFSEPARLDQAGAGLLLPSTRISHFKAGFYCGLQLLEEVVRWNWTREDGSRSDYRRRLPWSRPTARA
jgi:glycosyltransferase involved in cell wall biosynthesis